MFTSVYETSEILSVIAGPGPFITQNEKITINEDITIIDVCYTSDGKYVGNVEHAQMLLGQGIIEQLQICNDGKCCSIGFNPIEQQWYAWSHRAMYGFGIGSRVSRGDVGYQPIDIIDLNMTMLDFWDVNDGIWRVCEDPAITTTTQLIYIEANTLDEEYGTRLGTTLTVRHVFKGADRDFTSIYFTPYPDVWGKGAWCANTLADAKEMALNFAKSID